VNVTNLVGKEARDLEDSGPRERHEHLKVWSEKIKYLEPDFTDLFRKGLRGLAPDGTADTGYSGREMTRNAAIGDLALATGLRLGEFTHLGDPGPAVLTDGDPDPVSSTGWDHQGPQVPHHLDLLRRIGRAARLPATGPGRGNRRIKLATTSAMG
jgi:hypothetical protein